MYVGTDQVEHSLHIGLHITVAGLQPEPQTAGLVIDGLERLANGCCSSLDDVVRLVDAQRNRHEDHLSIDHIEHVKRKAGDLDALKSSLLPSLRYLLTSLSLLLNQHDWTQKASPAELELALEIVPSLNVTVAKIFCATKSVSVLKPLPDKDHDHHLKGIKEFRCSRLLRSIKTLVVKHLCVLFMNCAQSIRVWELSSANHPANSESRTKAIQKSLGIQTRTDNSVLFIDKIIDLISNTDLAILRGEWLTVAGSLDPVLEVITNLSNASITPDMSLTPIEREKDQAHRERVVKVSRAIIPLIKLSRLFVKKISSTSTQKLPFTLDTELCSKTLEDLLDGPFSLACRLENFARGFSETHHKRSWTFGHLDTHAHQGFNELTKILEKSLTELNLHFIPSSSSDHDDHDHRMNERIGKDSCQNDFKNWSSDLKDLWYKAVDRCLQLYSSGPAPAEPLIEEDDEEADQRPWDTRARWD
ncbi:hypothetical protein Pst134EB_004510 [Puccinia striiformis f. sp. tritici]|nr:hypothetical protein Pst134EB_004510 [Puccinia striiformis f. sp. tritici]